MAAGGRRHPVHHHPAAAPRAPAARQAAPARLAPSSPGASARSSTASRPSTSTTPTRWERAEIGHRLFELFDMRFGIYKRKFIVKFLNNFLAQITPFFFYSVGGYLALARQPRHRPARRRHRRLSGTAAAAEGADRLGPAAARRAGQVRSGRPALRAGAAAAGSRARTLRQATTRRSPARSWSRGCSVMDPHGGAVIDARRSTCRAAGACRASSATAVRPPAPSRASSRAAARDYAGEVAVGERNLADLPHARRRAPDRLCGGRSDPVSGHASATISSTACATTRSATAEEDRREAMRRIAEAQRTGNPIESDHGALDRLRARRRRATRTSSTAS